MTAATTEPNPSGRQVLASRATWAARLEPAAAAGRNERERDASAPRERKEPRPQPGAFVAAAAFHWG